MIPQAPQTPLIVLFATHNGEHVLARTLNGYCQLEPPPTDWKLVIVDNGSTDASLDIIQSFSGRLPIQILQESRPGKNRALNRGLAGSDARLLVITDDDAVPLPAFLRAWAKFLDDKPDRELLGGSISPIFEKPPPAWILQDAPQFIMLFGARDLPEGPVTSDEIFGANMAVRRSAFDRGFRFDEAIGPNASDLHYRMGGEAEFCRRLALDGAACWFAREPTVQHIVRPHQITDDYLARRSYRLGRGWAYQQWDRGRLTGGAPRPVFEEGLARLRRRLQMGSPFSLQRRRAIYSYYCERGFRDEFNTRAELTRAGAAGESVEAKPGESQETA